MPAFAPQVRQPVETSELEWLELAARLEVLGILGNLLVRWAGMNGIADGASRNSRPCRAFVILSNGLLSLILDLIVG